jgi:hypothetical protein
MSLPARCDICLLRRRQDRYSWRAGRPVIQNKSSCGMMVMVQPSTGGRWPSLMLRRLARQQFCPASNLRKLLTFGRLCTFIHDTGTAGLPGGQQRLFPSTMMVTPQIPAGYGRVRRCSSTNDQRLPTSVIGGVGVGAGLEVERRGRAVVPSPMPRR